ncbi:hypothetical protein GDO81_020708 [Engystomops pustulosus]|uniref:Uncharacterized protein n=1 Tax=Engystomops pustulosus TaxID=76066 RepID=A0AAV6ZQ20_ENGPU|nr:hypothetical protein GDO81_020708 [Engystomops pustulosus]
MVLNHSQRFSILHRYMGSGYRGMKGLIPVLSLLIWTLYICMCRLYRSPSSGGVHTGVCRPIRASHFPWTLHVIRAESHRVWYSTYAPWW